MEQRRRTASKFFPVYQPALNLDFRSGFLPPEITFSRANTATFIGSNGLIQVAAANTPRFNYNPALSQIPRLLVEAEARTNLVLESRDLNASPWLRGASLSNLFTVTTDALIGPDGVGGVAKFVTGAVTAEGLFARTLLSLPVATYAVAPYIYVPTQPGVTNWSLIVDAQDTVDSGQSAIFTTFDRWVRAPLSLTTTGTRTYADFNIRRNGVAPTNGDGFTFYVCCAQIEVGASSSSYIPTTAAAAVTRAADVAVVTGSNFGKWFNPWNGTFAVKAVTPAGIGSVSQAIIEADLGDTNNRHVLFRDNFGFAFAQTGVNAVTQANIALGAWTNNTLARQAYSYAPNNFNGAFAGVLGMPNNNGTTPNCNQLVIGNTAAANRAWMGEIEWLRYWQQDADPKMVQYLTSNIYD